MRFFWSINLLILLLITSCGRDEITDPPIDDLPPAPPASLRVYYALDGEIGIEWIENNSSDFQIYNIYRSINDTSNFIKISETASSYFVDDSLFYDSLYFYKVTTLDNKQRESKFSNTVSAAPKNFYKPLTPRYVEINARNWDDKVSIFLNWQPSYDTDIKGYNIYRSNEENFEADSSHFTGFSENPFYEDNSDLELLTEYFYKVVAVDKGDLVSNPSSEVSDLILDKPELIFPPNDSDIKDFISFKIKTVSEPVDYKIVIQSNEYFGTVDEINFFSREANEEIEVEFYSNRLERYKKYYWRVFTYTKSENPNSFSELNSFTIIN